MDDSSANISPMMLQLNRTATEAARRNIADKFADIHDLDEIPAYSVQLQKQLQSATSQLDGAVQGKLDALKRAVDLMDESAVKLSNFMLNMRRVDERINQTNSSIASFENLKRVHNVRDNLNRVISLIDYFANIPDNERKLRETLERDGTKIKEVFVESLKLNSLRIALMNELRDNEKQFVEQQLHLRVVPALAEYISQTALENIGGFIDSAGRQRDFYDLALDSPAELVATFEVIEMHQQYYDRRKAQLERKLKSRAAVIEQMMVFEIYSMRESALSALNKRISFRIEVCFNEFVTGYAQEKKSKAMAVIDAGSELIKLFVDIINDVSPCIPKEYDVINTYFTLFDFQLEPRINELIEGISSLTVGDIINVVDWLKYFNSQMERFGIATEDNPSCLMCCERNEAIAEKLMKEYLSRIKAQVMKWFDNIRKQPLDIVDAGDRTLITSNPEDMFNVIHAQLSVARENLPAECLKDVVIACMEVLETVQSDTKTALAKNWKEVTPETMCSIINDNQRMQEKCEEFADSITPLIPTEEEKEALMMRLQDVASEYITVAATAVGYLARIVLEDLEEPVFQQLFSPAWEGGEQYIPIAIATIKDYLVDFSKWLTEYFYCKIAYELLCKCTAMYVMSLRRFTPGSFKFGLEFKAAKTIIDDEQILAEFFNDYHSEIVRGGAGRKQPSSSSSSGNASSDSPIRDELSVMRALSMIISAGHISSVESEVKLLYSKYGIDGQKLVISAINSNPALSKTDRAEMLDAASNIFLKKSNVQYSNVQSDEYKNVADAHVDLNTVSRVVKQKTRMFWG